MNVLYLKTFTYIRLDTTKLTCYSKNPYDEVFDNEVERVEEDNFLQKRFKQDMCLFIIHA